MHDDSREGRSGIDAGVFASDRRAARGEVRYGPLFRLIRNGFTVFLFLAVFSCHMMMGRQFDQVVEAENAREAKQRCNSNPWSKACP